MTPQTITVRNSKQYILKTGMDSAADKEERKREVCIYNNLFPMVIGTRLLTCLIAV